MTKANIPSAYASNEPYPEAYPVSEAAPMWATEYYHDRPNYTFWAAIPRVTFSGSIWRERPEVMDDEDDSIDWEYFVVVGCAE